MDFFVSAEGRFHEGDALIVTQVGACACRCTETGAPRLEAEDIPEYPTQAGKDFFDARKTFHLPWRFFPHLGYHSNLVLPPLTSPFFLASLFF